MTWKIEFDREVEKDLKKIDRQNQKRILAYLREKVMLCHNPRQFGKPLTGQLTGLWRYRVGDYRLLCRIEDASLVVLVIRIGHRKDVYQ